MHTKAQMLPLRSVCVCVLMAVSHYQCLYDGTSSQTVCTHFVVHLYHIRFTSLISCSPFFPFSSLLRIRFFCLLFKIYAHTRVYSFANQPIYLYQINLFFSPNCSFVCLCSLLRVPFISVPVLAIIKRDPNSVCVPLFTII